MVKRTPILRALAGVAILSVSACSTPVSPTPIVSLLGISCPASVVAQSVDGRPVPVAYPAPVVTGGSQPIASACTPSSGSMFSVGSTPVTCTARDSRQQTATCGFSITVDQVPRLSATRFLAFGDSITAGVIAQSCPFGGGPTGLFGLNDTALLWADLNASPGKSYPDVLSQRLSSRYVAQSFTVANEGLPSERAVEGVLRFPQALASVNPDVVLLLEGVNDVHGGASAIPGVISSLRTMIRSARQRGATVFVSTILPERPRACRAYDEQDGVDDISAANLQIRSLAASEQAVLVDLHPQFLPQLSTWLGLDGLHPNEDGYVAMAQAFFTAIRARFE